MRKGEADRPPSKANFALRVQVFRLYLSSPQRHRAAPLPQEALRQELLPQKVVHWKAHQGHQTHEAHEAHEAFR